MFHLLHKVPLNGSFEGCPIYFMLYNFKKLILAEYGFATAHTGQKMKLHSVRRLRCFLQKMIRSHDPFRVRLPVLNATICNAISQPHQSAAMTQVGDEQR